ncbi:hypothetical protein [Sphingobacterium paludis]|uniref:Uncharacterized protein n=1 Tax=Sphingobacterium paludis TaxID=1476465 RepID=A0A4V3E0T0_9SPHI|nr:hypothetical protein [Sphingobacterium paludis]TDS05980.1 hypothetical protein B0I21_11814 [Sphingobacterium paludis]
MNTILTINVHQLKILIGIAAKMGATMAFTESGHVRRYLKRSEAFKMYGRKNVEEMIRAGLIFPRKDGNFSAAWRIDRLEIGSVQSAKELIVLFTNPIKAC